MKAIGYLCKTGISFLVSRSGFFYVLVLIVICLAVDTSKLYFKTMDYYGWVPNHTLNMVRNKPNFSGVALRDAVYYYKSLLKVKPDSVGARSALALFYAQIGNWNKSGQYYLEATQLADKNYSLFHNLGIVYMNAGDFKMAIASFEKEISLPEDREIFFLQVADPYQPHIQRPNEMYVKTKIAKSYIYLIQAHLQLGQYEDMYKTAIKGMAQSVLYKDTFLYYAGLSAYHLKKYPEAVQLIKQSLIMNPRLIESYMLLEEISQEEGQMEPYQQILKRRQALESSGQSSSIKEHLPEQNFYLFPPVQVWKTKQGLSRIIL